MPGASVQHHLLPPTLDDFELTLPSAVSVVPLDPPRPSPKCEPKPEVDVGERPAAGHLAAGATTADATAVAPEAVPAPDATDGGLWDKPCANDESDEVSTELRRLQAELGSLIRAHTPLRAAVQVRARMDMAQARVVASRKREERVLLGKLREFRRAKQNARAYSRSPGGGPACSGYASARASPNSSGPASPRSRRPRRVDVEEASPDAIASLVLPSSTTSGGAARRMPALPPLVLDMCVPASLPGRGAPRSEDGGDALHAAFGQQGAVQVRGEVDDSTQPLGTQLLGWVDSALMALRGFTPAVPGTTPVYAAASPGGGPRPFGAASPGRGAPTGDELGAYLLALSKAAQPRTPSESPPPSEQQPLQLTPAGGLGVVGLVGATHGPSVTTSLGAAGGDAVPEIDVRQLRPVRPSTGPGTSAAEAVGEEAGADACAPVFVDAAEAWQRFRVLRLELERTRTLAALIQRRENIKNELNDVTFQRFEAALATAQEYIEYLEPTPAPPSLPPTPSSPGMRPFSLAAPSPVRPSLGAALVSVGGRSGVSKPARRSSPGTGPRPGGSVPAMAGGGLTAHVNQLPGRRALGAAALSALARTPTDLRRVLGQPPLASVSNPAQAEVARSSLSVGAATGSRAMPASPACGTDAGAATSVAQVRVVDFEPSALVAGLAAAGGASPVGHDSRTQPLASPAITSAGGRRTGAYVGATEELPSAGPCVAEAAQPAGQPSAAVIKPEAAWAVEHDVPAAAGGPPPLPASLPGPLRSRGMASPASRITAPAVATGTAVVSLEGHTTTTTAWPTTPTAPAVPARVPCPTLAAPVPVVTAVTNGGGGGALAPPLPAAPPPSALSPTVVAGMAALAGCVGVTAPAAPTAAVVTASPVCGGSGPLSVVTEAERAAPPSVPVVRVADATTDVLLPPPTTSAGS